MRLVSVFTKHIPVPVTCFSCSSNSENPAAKEFVKCLRSGEAVYKLDKNN